MSKPSNLYESFLKEYLNPYMANKIIAFIPLRNGSKGIIGKNHKQFIDKPLFQWVLDTALTSHAFDEVWIATDDNIVKAIVAEMYSGQVFIFHRSRINAGDDSPSTAVVLEFLNGHSYSSHDKLVLLQATSPQTTVRDIQAAISKIENNQYDSVLSCARLKHFRWTEDGHSIDYNWKNKPRRQDFKGYLIESGALYGSTIQAIKQSKQLISGTVGIIEMNDHFAIDIDEPIDWELAETYVKYLQNGEK